MGVYENGYTSQIDPNSLLIINRENDNSPVGLGVPYFQRDPRRGVF